MKNLKTHKVLDLTYHEDEGQSCFVGTEKECNDFIESQGGSNFTYEVASMTKEEVENYPDNQNNNN